jgi:hypothetical protein
MGFGNRFGWFQIRASKSLPAGGHWNSVEWNPLVDRFRAAFKFSREKKRYYSMQADPDTWAIWEPIYHVMSQGRPGLVGAMLARSATNITRFAIAYALLDRSEVIRPHHLIAALAVWRYCEDSVLYIFGEKWADKDAERLLDALKKAPSGLTSKEISTQVFNKHKPKGGLNALLSRLWSEGYIHQRIEDTGRRGPKPKRWFLGDSRRRVAVENNRPQETGFSPQENDKNVTAGDENEAPNISEGYPNQSGLSSLSDVGPISEPELPQEAK